MRVLKKGDNEAVGHWVCEGTSKMGVPLVSQREKTHIPLQVPLTERHPYTESTHHGTHHVSQEKGTYNPHVVIV